MNEAPPTQPANSPSRPDLFMRSPAGAANPPSKRISVLASLDTKPAAKRKQGRGARWGLASVLILALAGIGGWLTYANIPALAAARVAEHSSASRDTHAVTEHAAPADAPLATPVAPHESAQATLNMPASIEDLPVPNLPPQAALSAPAAAGSGLAAALAAPSVAATTASTPAEPQAAHASSLLSALAAPSAKPKADAKTDTKAESKPKTAAKSAEHKKIVKNEDRDRLTDTDVILLEALVAQSARRTDKASALGPKAAP